MGCNILLVFLFEVGWRCCTQNFVSLCYEQWTEIKIIVLLKAYAKIKTITKSDHTWIKLANKLTFCTLSLISYADRNLTLFANRNFTIAVSWFHTWIKLANHNNKPSITTNLPLLHHYYPIILTGRQCDFIPLNIMFNSKYKIW